MTEYHILSENTESTVVMEYTPAERTATSYESEAALEEAFIRQLVAQKYERLTITSEADLIGNLRRQLERLNDTTFSDSEWQRFFKEVIANPNDDIPEKTALIQENHIQLLTRDNGKQENIYLVNKNDIHENHLQVLNQYETEDGNYKNRYDVTILVNGLPLVHIELKRRGIDIKEAFNQINRYQRDSFWSGCGLFQFVQIFVISNGTFTKYYSNTTRRSHIKEIEGQQNKKTAKQTSNSFEFTSYWATEKNKVINDLVDFTRTFFSKHTILNVLFKYCIFNVDRILMVMRPYQIVAAEMIIRQIQIANNYKKYGTIDAGGYVWHTTGSGKTLTSFKAARLASQLDFLDKVLFVVDRKDLDYQTMKEYEKFEKGAANSNTSSEKLRQQLQDDESKIIITTIQKLSSFIKKYPGHDAFKKHIVFIFDECHRSQFGEMHNEITKNFKKYHLFGFTGTPIFPDNAPVSGKTLLRTTEQAFGKKLHTYTIVNAIGDGNVLPFRTEFYSTMRKAGDVDEEKVSGIDKDKAFRKPKRISDITKHILDNFIRQTKRNGKSYEFNALQNIEEVASAKNPDKVKEIKEKIRLSGFNAMFAVDSIPSAKAYYYEFKKQMDERPELQRLKIATIFSYGANEDVDGFFGEDENPEDTTRLDQSSRDFLEEAIRDYNIMFRTNFDTSSDKFQNYYKDVSLRMKNRELDLLIVVNMFLTGFDATTMNTLWVDKNLKMHGLIQAFSRTNRILNSIKTFGNIICYRDLEEATNTALSRFGDEDAKGIMLIRPFDDYYNGYTEKDGKVVKGYKQLVEELLAQFTPGQMILGEEQQKAFIRLYGLILKQTNILNSFEQFDALKLLSERDVQDFHSMYIDLHDRFKEKREKGEAVDISDDIVFEMELIKQIEINIDYILALVAKHRDELNKDKEIRGAIERAVNSSPNLRNKKDLIEAFIDSVTPTSDINDDWNTFVRERQKMEIDRIIQEEKLKQEETYKFMQRSFQDGGVQEIGTEITTILPPVSRFNKGGDRTAKKNAVIEKLKGFYDKFADISHGMFFFFFEKE